MLWQRGLEKSVVRQITNRAAFAVASVLLLAIALVMVHKGVPRQDVVASAAPANLREKAAADSGTLTATTSQGERKAGGVSQVEKAAVPSPAASDAGIANALIRSALNSGKAQAPDQAAQQPEAARKPEPNVEAAPVDPLSGWVQSTREIVLWSTSDDAATRLSTIPEGSLLHVQGQPTNGCLPVRLEGDNGTGSVSGWVNAGDVRSSGSPVRVVASSRGGLRSIGADFSTHDGFISVIAQAAQQSQQATGVPAAVTIAQAILESDWGKSLLATEGSNYFGIKALNRAGPAGVVDMDTWEVINGNDTVVNAAFKAYHNVFESVSDHGNFLRDNPRYAAAFQVAGDPREFARRINAAGYATDPSYSAKLIGLMDKYNLYRYDLPTP